MEKQLRSAGLDIVRVLAVAFVVSSHFFLYTSFKEVEFSGIEMFVLGMGATLFGTNVCLFMMLTGYLNINKIPCMQYYKGGVRVLVSYLLFSLLVIAFRIYWLGDSFTWLQWTEKVLDYSAIPYAWYIEMWIGLFLLTPFLNMMWRGADNKRNRLWLMATLFALTALPDFTNRYGMYVFPGWWRSAASVMLYFFLGCYIREYQPMVNKKLVGGGILLLCLINPVFNVVFVSHHTMLQVIGGWGGIVIYPLTVLVFLLFYKADVRSTGVRKLLKSVSVLSLDMYLVSYMFDALYYPLFSEHLFHGQPQYTLTFFTVVPSVLLSSYTVAWVKNKIL